MEPGLRWLTTCEAASVRVLIATPVTARVARLAAGTADMTLDAGLAADPGRLPGELASVRPHTLVVGASPVTAEAIHRWAGAMNADGDTHRLLVVRRGTSLASIDVEAATAAGVDVVNTPGVNARHVAAFVTRRLFPDTPVADGPITNGSTTGGSVTGGPLRNAATVGIVGAGHINSRVARAAAARGYHLVVFTPSLAGDAGARRTWLHTHRLPPGAVTFAADVDDVVAVANLLSIAVPLTRNHPHPTRGLVDAHHIKRFTGTRIVSVSEPDVFTDAALVEAYAKGDIDVVLDNAPYLLGPVRRLVDAHGTIDTGRALRTGRGPAELRAGFTLSSEAIRAPDCAADLDEAFLAVLATANLTEQAGIAEHTGMIEQAEHHEPEDPASRGCGAPSTTESHQKPGVRTRPEAPTGWPEPGSYSAHVHAGHHLDHGIRVGDQSYPNPAWPLPRRRGPDADVVVVGGGIVGLTVAFGLLTGGWRRLRVLDASPTDRTDPTTQGTTFAGTNGRHLSSTETLPHANPTRAGVLACAAEGGGWLLREPATLNVAERRWVEAFEQRTDRPSLHTLASSLVTTLNRFGLRGWEALATAHPEVLAGLRWDTRLTRAYLNAADLDQGRMLQAGTNRQVRELRGDEVSASWPALRQKTDGDPDPDRGGDPDAGDAGLGDLTIHGFVEVDGYGVNIHDLAGALHAHLVASGVEIRAGARVSRITPAGSVVQLTFADGTTTTAESVVVTTGGVDLAALLGDAWPAASSVQGVLGVSVTVPNPGIHRPLKIHTPDPLGVVNLTASPDGAFVHASGGFGFVGQARPSDLDASIDSHTDIDSPANASTYAEAAADPPASTDAASDGRTNVDPPDATVASPLVRLLEDLLGRLFPALLRPDGTLDVVDRRTCIRPMTADGVPVVEALDAFGGRVIVAVGTNAGGTVQAPALAALAGALLDGRPGAAHLALHGSRPSLGIPVPTPA